MRTLSDRIRHMVLFEMIALLISSPLVAMAFDRPVTTIAGMSVALSSLAMVWNGLFNWLFDLCLVRINRPLYPRSLVVRIVHSIVFEGVFLLVSLPIAVYFLQVSLFEAFMADIGFVLFFLVYACLFNWVYDILFPLNGEAA